MISVPRMTLLYILSWQAPILFGGWWPDPVYRDGWNARETNQETNKVTAQSAILPIPTQNTH